MIDQNLPHQRYLVTGAAGFIGSHLCEALVKLGKQVVAVDNLAAGKRENMAPWWDDRLCRFYETDIATMSDEEASDMFHGVDVVFHNAASKCTVCRDYPQRDLTTNAWGAWRVFDAANKAGVAKVVHASTGTVMGGEPPSFYGVSKLAGESYLRAFANYYPDFNYSALRYYHVYGPRQDRSDRGGVIPIFIRQILREEPCTIYGDGEQVRHFTHVSDVVRANFLMVIMAEETRGRYFDLRRDEATSILALAIRLYGMMGEDEIRLMFKPKRQGDIAVFSQDNSPIKELGFTWNVALRDGLLNTIEWMMKGPA